MSAFDGFDQKGDRDHCRDRLDYTYWFLPIDGSVNRAIDAR